MDHDPVEDFWEASSLDRFSVRDLGRALASYDADDKELSLAFPRAPEPLPSPKSRLNRLAAARRSERAFTGEALTRVDVGAVLSPLQAWDGLEHRGYPSAGAAYATEVFWVEFARSDSSGAVSYYDAEVHGLVPVSGSAPSWDEARDSVNVTVEGTPAALLVLVVLPERLTAKYGARGARFALLEAGAAMQCVALAIAESSRLRGFAAGGLLDRDWLAILGLADAGARLAVGYLVGR